MPNKYLVIFLLLVSSSVRAQHILQLPGKSEDAIVYQSPNDGDTFVPARTTLIIKLAATLAGRYSAQDFLFDAYGDSSGQHSGKVVISDDNRTVIFKPDHAYTLNEKVHICFTYNRGKGNAVPYCYGFQITNITDRERSAIITSLRKKEERETREQANQSVLKAAQKPLAGGDPSGAVIDIFVPGKVAPGYIFAGQAGGSAAQDLSHLAIIDNKGFSRFFYNVPWMGYVNFQAYPASMNYALSYFRVDTVAGSDAESGKGIILDSNFNVIDSFACDSGYIANEHEFQYLPHNHAFLIAYDTRVMDMRVVTGDPNAAKRASIVGGIIQELDSNKNVVFEWRSWDHFKISDIARLDITNPNHTEFDYTHLNSVRQDTDGNIIASFNAMDEVTKISRETGKIMWRFGGKNNYFTLKGDTLQFSGQHDPHTLPNGHLIMFDNGIARKTQWADGSYHDTEYSRVIEYDLDLNSLTATAVWQYRNIPTTFAGGNVQRFENGNTFIGLGILNIPNAIEITSSGEKVFQLSFSQGGFNYRTFRFDYPFPKASASSTPSSGGDPFGIVALYPNPSRTTTTVTFSAAQSGLVQIDLVDFLGNTIRSLTKSITNPGTFSAELDIHDLTAGTYYCKLSQHGTIMIKKLVVQK